MFEKKDINKLTDNIFDLIGNQWMLITAGSRGSFNTMTASWGGLGVLWNKNVATIYIRPQRYTNEFVMKNDFFTLCFFDKKHKDILRFCGAHSGKDVDKIAKTGLVPVETKSGNIIFEQARLVLECKKIYSDRIEEENIIETNTKSEIYPKKDFHFIYIGEIINCMANE